MSPVVTMSQLLEAGVHFGHQTRRWNPKMQRFIFGERNGIYLLDLNQTLDCLAAAYAHVRDTVAKGGLVLFVGTKKQTRDSLEQFAERCPQPYVNQRWLGGMLTNFETMAKRVAKMKEYQRMREAGEFDEMPKKEALMLSRELSKLERNLGGIRTMRSRPQIVFVLDTKKEHIAVTEANKLGIPVIAVVDTNCDPDVIDFVIPGNDDAIRSSELMCRVICEAVEEGQLIASKHLGDITLSGEETVERTEEDERAIAEEQELAKKAAAEAFREKEKKIAEEILSTPGDESATEETQETS
ncbi:MAG: 30S ribosomal protein S2 [Actinomycetota bacterium]|nr:30S ribosomal protein S2 [Actinomycetota bacterium]